MRRKKEKSWPPSLPPFPGAVEAQSGKGREGPFLPSPPLPCTGVGINHCDRARASTYNTSFQIRNARGFGSLAMEKGERGDPSFFTLTFFLPPDPTSPPAEAESAAAAAGSADPFCSAPEGAGDMVPRPAESAESSSLSWGILSGE